MRRRCCPQRDLKAKTSHSPAQNPARPLKYSANTRKTLTREDSRKSLRKIPPSHAFRKKHGKRAPAARPAGGRHAPPEHTRAEDGMV